MRPLRTVLFLTIFTIFASQSLAQDRFGGSMRDLVPTSPKEAWRGFEAVQKADVPPWWEQALLWVPNRLLDFIDIFRVDAGVGPAFGAVARVTKWGQLGYRQMAPASVRIGDLGRRFPIMVESSNEFGVGPTYLDSSDRKVCPGEIGLGGDLVIAGLYAGVCVDEVADFLAGIFLIDLKDDDWQP